ncbi:unnamed protein product [Mytilus coruscus]|uniref:Reverse transcriptase domain-containing protein n=1 Tax=Mytilus coruscus TaxID=42192 RepID=A0A6J8BXW0_MYTCO|nr:unnamed protein product [Mytilus coruscus]
MTFNNLHPITGFQYCMSMQKTERIKSKCQSENIRLGNEVIQTDNQATHLGIIQAAKNESRINIQEHISIARKTLYSLIPVGLNGKGGLNPKTANKIYQAYVLPRLLYGLEILSLSLTQIRELRQFHIKTIRCFQSLPIRTSAAAYNLLIGAIPIDTELHKRQLKVSLLYSVRVSENTKLRTLKERQLIVNSENPESFFPRVQEIIKYNNLMQIHELIKSLPTKCQWKKQINTVIANKWTSKLQAEMKE